LLRGGRSTGVDVEKRLELVTVMENARDPLRQMTEKAIKVFPKNMTDFLIESVSNSFTSPVLGNLRQGITLFKGSQNYQVN